MRDLGSYGRHVSAGNILGVVNSTVDNVAVGRILGPAALGFYAIVFRIADYPSTVIGYVVAFEAEDLVAYPLPTCEAAGCCVIVAEEPNDRRTTGTFGDSGCQFRRITGEDLKGI